MKIEAVLGLQMYQEAQAGWKQRSVGGDKYEKPRK